MCLTVEDKYKKTCDSDEASSLPLSRMPCPVVTEAGCKFSKAITSSFNMRVRQVSEQFLSGSWMSEAGHFTVRALRTLQQFSRTPSQIG